jgi:DNA repair photolyase
MNPHQISRINLSPSVVDCIVFWSKNPKRMLPKLKFLKGYYYYFQYTITAYGQMLEPNVPSRQEAIEIFIHLSNMIGENRIIWRYDPVILTNEIDVSFHKSSFEQIAKQLSGKTNRCVISFVDLYKKTMRNMSSVSIHDFPVSKMIETAKVLNSIASYYGFELVSCAEEIDLSQMGIKHGKCIDDKLIEEISGYSLNITKDKTQRAECGCVASVDVGAYNTCPHGCLYCYANYSLVDVQRNYSMHNPESPLLYGEVQQKDKITDRNVPSCRESQQRLDFKD